MERTLTRKERPIWSRNLRLRLWFLGIYRFITSFVAAVSLSRTVFLLTFPPIPKEVVDRNKLVATIDNGVETDNKEGTPQPDNGDDYPSREELMTDVSE